MLPFEENGEKVMQEKENIIRSLAISRLTLARSFNEIEEDNYCNIETSELMNKLIELTNNKKQIYSEKFARYINNVNINELKKYYLSENIEIPLIFREEASLMSYKDFKIIEIKSTEKKIYENIISDISKYITGKNKYNVISEKIISSINEVNDLIELQDIVSAEKMFLNHLYLIKKLISELIKENEYNNIKEFGNKIEFIENEINKINY